MGDHGHVLVDVTHCERGEASHGSVNGIRGQVGAHFAVVAVGRDCSNHVGWVDVLQGCLETFFLEICYDLCL